MHRAGLPLRPTSRLTFAEASADRGAINLRRSVLGAHGNLGRATRFVKCLNSGKVRNLRSFVFESDFAGVDRGEPAPMPG